MTWFICFFQWRCSSSNTLRYSNESVRINIYSSSLNFTLSSICFQHDLKMMSFVLPTFRYNLLTFNHWESFFRSWFLFILRSIRDGLDCRIFVSSAMWYALGCFIHLLRPFMYIRKKCGPKTEPWGTPAMIFIVLNNNLLC